MLINEKIKNKKFLGEKFKKTIKVLYLYKYTDMTVLKISKKVLMPINIVKKIIKEN